jgi:hypothetical protein
LQGLGWRWVAAQQVKDAADHVVGSNTKMALHKRERFVLPPKPLPATPAENQRQMASQPK